jgi:hypothetical protein
MAAQVGQLIVQVGHNGANGDTVLACLGTNPFFLRRKIGPKRLAALLYKSSQEPVLTRLCRSFALGLACLAPLPAFADAAREMDQGISACLFYGDDAQKVHETLSAEGWEGDVDNEAGIGYIYPNGSEATVVTVGMDGTWCNVESFVQSSEKSAMQLLAYLEGPESPFEVSYDKSEMGCTQFGIGDGWAVSILSGGQDPICGAEDNSAVRVEYITQ